MHLESTYPGAEAEVGVHILNGISDEVWTLMNVNYPGNSLRMTQP